MDTAMVGYEQKELAKKQLVEEVMDVYLAELDASQKTRDTYRRALRQYGRWLNEQGLGLQDTTRATTLAYKRYLQDTKSAATTNSYLCAVRSLHSWLNGKVGYPNVAQGIHGVKAGTNSSKDALTKCEALDLLQSDDTSISGLRDHAMICLMLLQGLRTIELVRASVGDLRTMGGEAVLWIQGKGHDAADTFVPLSPESERSIRAYLSARGKTSDEMPLFASTSNRNSGGRMTTRSVSRMAKERMKAIGVESQRKTAHSLRHTAVTFALLGGATVQEAQVMARHSDIGTTLRYAHNLDRMDAKAEKAVASFLGV